MPHAKTDARRAFLYGHWSGIVKQPPHAEVRYCSSLPCSHIKGTDVSLGNGENSRDACLVRRGGPLRHTTTFSWSSNIYQLSYQRPTCDPRPSSAEPESQLRPATLKPSQDIAIRRFLVLIAIGDVRCSPLRIICMNQVKAWTRANDVVFFDLISPMDGYKRFRTVLHVDLHSHL